MKECTKCNSTKTTNEFYKAKTNSDGLMKWCKSCEKLRKKTYYKENSESIKGVASTYRDNNKEVIKKRKAQYHKDNKEYYNDKSNEYYRMNKEQFIEYARRRRALKSSTSDGTVTKEFLSTLLHTQNNLCFYCGSRLEDLESYDIHLDHYIPLSKGGVHSAGNVVWACSTCNHNKYNALPDKPLTFKTKKG